MQRRTHSRTINAPNAAYATETMQVDGETVVGADGSVVQYFLIHDAKIHFFNLESVGVSGADSRAYLIEIDLWTAMPNKVLNAEIQLVRAATDAHSYADEASEYITAWYPKGSNRSRAAFNIRRWYGGRNEPFDIVIKVEGY